MKAYLAGPMTGIPQFNFPAFDTAATALRVSGWEIVSPAEMDDPETRRLALLSTDGKMGSASPHGQTWGDFLARDVKLVADMIDAIILLPRWQKSRGARLEAFVALLSDKAFYVYDSFDGRAYIVEAEWVLDEIYREMAGVNADVEQRCPF